jgi:CO/xanthine dehydrogenase Mo-binding subunit
MHHVPEDLLFLEDGMVRSRGQSEKHRIALKDLAKYALYEQGGQLIGTGSFLRSFPEYDKSSIEGFVLAPSLPDCTYIAHAAEIEIDKTTGKLKVRKYVAAQDIGIAINPVGAEAQIHGGAVQGIGFALHENMNIDEETGLPSVLDLDSYKMPAASEVPEIETIIVEGHYGAGPFGAKGVGEANIIPPAGAIANAFFAASDIRIGKLPLAPESVRDALTGRML